MGAQPTYDYGFSLRVPLFDGGRRDARRAESLSQYRQEQTRTRDLEQQVELDVRLALDSITFGGHRGCRRRGTVLTFPRTNWRRPSAAIRPAWPIRWKSPTRRRGWIARAII